jgi:CRP-like cAMP-binding protein
VVGAGLKVGELQDLQSSTHAAFDIRSDGLIALSGIDRDMRKNTHTGTDLTAALLMQTGDCRETMYLNGAFFASWQQLQVKKRLASAMLCLELNYIQGFESIINEVIPQLMRYQVRGGQVAVYGESIAMRGKYHSEQVSADDPTAAFRPYGIDELRRKKPLTQYELENAKIKITFTDGSVLWLEPKDPNTGKWRLIDHTPVPGGGIPLIPNAGDDYENIHSLQLLNFVEEHALTFLYDSDEQTVRLSDGFYNQNLYGNSPYAFAGDLVNLEDLRENRGLLRAGSRLLKHADGSVQEYPVYLEFLPFSQTDYEAALVEGDIPGTIQLMGKIFKGDLRRERKRMEEGVSPIPALLEKVHEWERARRASPALDKTTAERRLARLILDLARDRPELIQLQEVNADQPVIIEGTENDRVFLVLSGQFMVTRNGKPICSDAGEPIVSTAGGILGELTALRGGVASATVAGNGMVFGITMSVVRQHLADDQAFRSCMEELTQYRVE